MRLYSSWYWVKRNVRVKYAESISIIKEHTYVSVLFINILLPAKARGYTFVPDVKSKWFPCKCLEYTVTGVSTTWIVKALF